MRNSRISGLCTLSGNNAGNAVIAGNALAACHKSFGSLCFPPPDNPSLPVLPIIFPFGGAATGSAGRLPVPDNTRRRDQNRTAPFDG